MPKTNKPKSPRRKWSEWLMSKYCIKYVDRTNTYRRDPHQKNTVTYSQAFIEPRWMVDYLIEYILEQDVNHHVEISGLIAETTMQEATLHDILLDYIYEKLDKVIRDKYKGVQNGRP